MVALRNQSPAGARLGHALRSLGLLPLLLLLALLGSGAGTLGAEVLTRVRLDAVNRTEPGDQEVLNYFSGQARFSFESAGDPDTRAELSFNLALAELVQLQIHRAFLRTRLPGFRFTLGKTRLSWGEGVMFNAGDVLFAGEQSDLTAEELRSSARWLAALYRPLGDFSFAEAVVFLPVPSLEQLLTLSLGGAPPATLPTAESLLGTWKDLEAGLRLYTRLGDWKVETGYFFARPAELEHRHRPYLSLQGHWGADLHLSSRLELLSTQWDQEQLERGWEISAGAYWLIPLQQRIAATAPEAAAAADDPWAGWDESADPWADPWGDDATDEATSEAEAPETGTDENALAASAPANDTVSAANASDTAPAYIWVDSDQSLNLRLEARILPFGRWERGNTGATELPGLALYPEISWSDGDRTSLFFRALVLPLEPSALLTLGTRWALAQGLQLFGAASLQAGASGSRYPTEAVRSLPNLLDTSLPGPGWSASVGLSYSF